MRFCNKAAQGEIQLSVLSNAQGHKVFATLAPVMAIRNRWRQDQGHPKGSEEGTPTAPPKPKEKASGQQMQARPQGTAGTSTAQGQGLIQDGLEQHGEAQVDRLRVQVVSSRTSSPKTPFSSPIEMNKCFWHKSPSTPDRGMGCS